MHTRPKRHGGTAHRLKPLLPFRHHPAITTPFTTATPFTIIQRAMGARVKPLSRERQSQRDKANFAQTKDKAGQPSSKQQSKGKDEVKSVLSQIETGSGKNRRVIPMSPTNVIYTTTTIPVLSFGDDGGDDAILSKEQYIAERKRTDEKLMWEHETNQMARLRHEHVKSKKNQLVKEAKLALPGIEMTPSLLKQSQKLVSDKHQQQQLQQQQQQQLLQKQKKQKQLYDLGDGDDDVTNTEDYDQMFEYKGTGDGDEGTIQQQQQSHNGKISTTTTPQKKKSKHQHDPEAVEERLNLKEQELVEKIKIRAFQAGQTVGQYCAQNNIAHFLPLFDLKPYKTPQELTELGGDEGGDDDADDDNAHQNNKIRKLTQRRNIRQRGEDGDDHGGDDGDDESNARAKRVFDQLADISDDEDSAMDTDGHFYDNDGDDYDHYDSDQDNDDPKSESHDPSTTTTTKSKQLQQRVAKITNDRSNTVEIGNLAKPLIFMQGEKAHTTQFSLSTFDQLQQSTSTGVRLNPKQRIQPKSTAMIRDQEDGNNNDLAHTKEYVHRTRPSLPDSTWLELGLNPALAGKLQSHHITNPTATQKLTIPFLIRRYNPRTGRIYVPPTVAIQDYTGSGKTFAYGLPALSNVDPNIIQRVPPPNVISAIRHLQGIKMANPPPLEMESTPLDEIDPKVRVIQYSDQHTFNNPNGIDPLTSNAAIVDKFQHFGEDFDHEDIADNDVETLLSTKSFIDRISNQIDIFNMTPAEWETHVFRMEKVEREAKLHKMPIISTTTATTPQAQIDVRLFNSRVYSLEAVRLRRKNQIQQRLRKIFPFIPTDLLDPDAPQSTLQSIIVVPTKELALQITKDLINANPTVFTTTQKNAQQNAHQLYGDKSLFVNTVRGKNPVHVRMATGQIDPILLASLGVFLHKGIDSPNTDAELNQYNQKKAYDSATGELVKAPKLTPEQKRQHDADQAQLRPHPFVQFGKGHKNYKQDQDEYRKQLKLREKGEILRVIRLRERQIQGEKLSKFEQVEVENYTQNEPQFTTRLDKLTQMGIGDEEAIEAFNRPVEDQELGYQRIASVRHNDDGSDGDNHNTNPGFVVDEMEGDADDLINPKILDFEDDPRKLMEMDDDMLMRKLDIFRSDFTKSKKFKRLSPEEQQQFKGRLASIMTKAHNKQQDLQRRAELNEIQAKQLASGRPVINFATKLESTEGMTPQQRANEVKKNYLQEVGDLLLEQIGGGVGDYVEVVRDKQPHILVGTPTTIVNLIKSGAIQLPSTGLGPHQLKSIVFDECDHLARNETSLEHRSLLELLSLPTDQSVFVSASMTRDNARLLTRLGQRQDLFINNKQPQFETVTNLLTLPRPKYKSLPDDVVEAAQQQAFEVAQNKVNNFNIQIEQKPLALNEIVLSSPRAKKDRLKLLTVQLQNPQERVGLVDKIVDQMYKQNFTPVIPDDVFHQSLQESINRGKLSYVTTSDEYGEVLFLSSEDYRSETQPTPHQLASAASSELHDPHALPIPPFVKQYYIAPPRLATIEQRVGGKEDYSKLKSNSYLKRVLKDNLALDLICQLKLRPLKTGSETKVPFTDPVYFKMLQDNKLASANNQQQQHQQQQLHRHHNELQHDIGEFGQELSQSGETIVAQQYLPKQQQQQRKVLAQTTGQVCPGTILVFFNPHREEDMMGLYRQLNDTGLKVGIYCSKSDRHQKYDVLARNEQLDVILANDSISRGIDFKNLSMVINVDPPRATTTFIHRSGRVGRVGGKFRKAATVVNIVDVVPTDPSKQELNNQDNNNTGQTARPATTTTTTTTTAPTTTPAEPFIPRHTSTYSLLKHAERTNVTINPWPYVVTHNISRVYLRSLKSIVSSETEKFGIKKHLDRKRKTEQYEKARNVKLHKMGIVKTKDTGLFDLAPGYSDSAFQPSLGGKSQSVAIHRLKAKVHEKQLRDSTRKPWIDTTKDNNKGRKSSKSLKH